MAVADILDDVLHESFGVVVAGSAGKGDEGAHKRDEGGERDEQGELDGGGAPSQGTETEGTGENGTTRQGDLTEKLHDAGWETGELGQWEVNALRGSKMRNSHGMATTVDLTKTRGTGESGLDEIR